MEEFILQAILKSLAGGGDTQGVESFSPKNILKNLGKKSDDEEDTSSFIKTAKAQSGSPPVYDPNKYYGGLYSMYGGRKVRGGLLGD
jgi:hypothetical protein